MLWFVKFTIFVSNRVGYDGKETFLDLLSDNRGDFIKNCWKIKYMATTKRKMTTKITLALKSSNPLVRAISRPDIARTALSRAMSPQIGRLSYLLVIFRITLFGAQNYKKSRK